MRDFFFQIVLFLAGALIGIIGQFVGKGSQKWIARILAVLLIVISLIWAGYELGAGQAIPLTATPLPTPTSTPSPISSVCPSLGGMHLGAGKQFIVTMYMAVITISIWPAMDVKQVKKTTSSFITVVTPLMLLYLKVLPGNTAVNPIRGKFA